MEDRVKPGNGRRGLREIGQPEPVCNERRLVLAFDFHGVSGYAAMRRPMHIEYPDNYEFDVRVRGSGPSGSTQLPVVTPNTGERFSATAAQKPASRPEIRQPMRPTA